MSMINDPDSFDPNANFNSNAANVPDALKPKAERVLTREQIKLRMYSNFGIEEDELDTLFPDDKSLTEFYHQALKLSKIENIKDLIQGKKARTDDYKLSKAEKVALKDIELNKLREERQKAAKKSAKKVQAQAAPVPVYEEPDEERTGEVKPQPVQTAEDQMNEIMKAGEHLPEEEQATEEDIYASLKLIGEMRDKKKKK